MTLGPKFYIFSVLSPRICFCFVNPYFLAGCAAFFAILRLAVSKHDLKGFWDIFSKNYMRPWIRRYRFYWTFAPGGRLNYEAYNVDTKSNFRPQILELWYMLQGAFDHDKFFFILPKPEKLNFTESLMF